MMESFHRGNTALIDEDYPKAVLEYSRSIATSGETYAPAYANRGLAQLQLKKYAEAIKDCDAALALDASLEHAYYRKGLACFELRDYKNSKIALEAGLRLCPESRRTQYQRALRKCESELSGTAITASDTAAPRAAAKPAADTDTKPCTPSATSTNAASASAGNSRPAVAPLQAVGVRYEYYQSLEKMCISVLAKNMSPADVDIVIKSNHLHVAVNIDGKKEVVLSKQLYATIDATKSSYEIRKAKIEIVLVKLQSQNWPSIEGSAPESLPTSESAPVASAAATTTEPVEKAAKTVSVPAALPKPYASARDWNKVTSDIERELAAEKPEGEEALQKLFRDIYGKADEDTRRAMNKSFQTSGGTVLSTNWKEVREKNYEQEKPAPKGLEWKSWEGDKLKKGDKEDD